VDSDLLVLGLDSEIMEELRNEEGDGVKWVNVLNSTERPKE